MSSIFDQLAALFKSLDVPDHIKRHFAADCAERALIITWEATGIVPDHRSIKAIDVARLHADGHATNQELASAWEDAEKAFWKPEKKVRVAAEAATEAVSHPASRATAVASRTAARCAAELADEGDDEIVWDAEYEWQLAHLKQVNNPRLKAEACSGKPD